MNPVVNLAWLICWKIQCHPERMSLVKQMSSAAVVDLFILLVTDHLVWACVYTETRIMKLSLYVSGPKNISGVL